MKTMNPVDFDRTSGPILKQTQTEPENRYGTITSDEVCNGCRWKTLFNWSNDCLPYLPTSPSQKADQTIIFNYNEFNCIHFAKHKKTCVVFFPAWLTTSSPHSRIVPVATHRALGVSGGHKTSETLKGMLPKCHGSRLAPEASLAKYSLEAVA